MKVTVNRKIFGILAALLTVSVSAIQCTKAASDDLSLIAAAALTSQTSSVSEFYMTERLAVIQGAGSVTANEALALKTANTIADYVKSTDETVAHDFPFGWVVAGQEQDSTPITDTSEALIVRPPQVLEKDGSTYIVKGNVVEMCNKGYATAAMGTGKYHAPALPCKIQVWADHSSDKIYVDLTDPRSVFALFFADITDPNQMKDSNGNVVNPETVYNEMKTLIKKALEGQSDITWVSEKIGPLLSVSDAKGTQKPFIIEKWLDSGATATTVKEASVRILDYLGTTGSDGTAVNLTAAKTAAEGWRSARVAVMKTTTGVFGTVPGGTENSFALSLPSDVQIIEMCSPKYAKAAMKYGMAHVGALPCKIAVYESNGALYVSYLNPLFMFNVLFSDVTISTDDAALAENVKTDTHSIVNQAINGQTLTGGTLKTTPDDVTSLILP